VRAQPERALAGDRAQNLVGAKRQAKLAELVPEQFHVHDHVPGRAGHAASSEELQRVQPLCLAHGHGQNAVDARNAPNKVCELVEAHTTHIDGLASGEGKADQAAHAKSNRFADSRAGHVA